MSSFYNTGLSGIKKLTRVQYDALATKDASTKYIVTDSGSVCEYLGEIPVSFPIVECTQSQYDNMQLHDSGTLYAIPEVGS